MKPNTAIILAGPSGVGKTVVADVLVQSGRAVKVITHTTRPPRHGEIAGQHYHFVGDHEFRQLADASQMLEWARVHDNWYGTSKTAYQTALTAGPRPLVILDPQGAAAVHELDAAATLVLLLPPSWTVLESRLRTRGLDDAAQMHRRLADARAWLIAAFASPLPWHAVVNTDIQECADRIVELSGPGDPRKLSAAAGAALRGL